ncbi:MAG: hypothetical protein ACI4XA_04120 [Oscillospiraceae bacterium]
MKAVIYESNTGHAERYAKALAEKLRLPCYDIKGAKKALPKGESVIFIGWVFANRIMGLDKAQKRWIVAAVGAVGLFPAVKANEEILISENKLTVPLFYLRGGIEFSKLGMLQRKLLKTVHDSMARSDDPEKRQAAELLEKDADFFSEDNLTAIAAFGLTKI